MRDTFATFAEAVQYYKQECNEPRYGVTVDWDPVARWATLRTAGEFTTANYVAIWPARDWKGQQHPTRVWGEEY